MLRVILQTCNYSYYMKKNSKTSVALHAIIHLIKSTEPVTSEKLGECLHTNPVVIRRVLGELKKAGIVASEKGHGGGWVVIKKPGDITFYDIFESLNDSLLPPPIALDNDEGCLIMRTIANTMEEFLTEADALLATKLKEISIDDVVRKM